MGVGRLVLREIDELTFFPLTVPELILQGLAVTLKIQISCCLSLASHHIRGASGSALFVKRRNNLAIRGSVAAQYCSTA